MALGMYEEAIYNVFTIPLEWESNDILANHFRMLADAIEEHDIYIQSIELAVDINNPYGKPRLEIKYKNKIF
jgi:hypothetical protein